MFNIKYQRFTYILQIVDEESVSKINLNVVNDTYLLSIAVDIA